MTSAEENAHDSAEVVHGASSAGGHAWHAEDEVMTEAMLKALTHPVRRRILRVLGQKVYARSADLAQALGVAANSVSFHVRTLADAGLIEEAPERARDRRDRVWTPVRGGLNVGTPEHPVRDEVLADALMRAMVEDHYDLVNRSSASWMEFIAGRNARMRSNFMHMNVPMDAETAETFFRTISSLADEAAERLDPDDPDVHVWEIDVIAADDTV
ncbi:transcriptional regulator [Microbacterium sp. MPKO10]|uniref:ArsR/SmtB family transcription factor n=1 Tax=Microbacterium sp. MPKO10 TaxID=2989818 RepID=UPI0022361610|nr:helix-turn-helix domain-containing protein [Microbacterium sp. MPKO10]MCW4459297.1 helix-turn-helix domain-containing protein [Microbacterium sp. MPKO10]